MKAACIVLTVLIFIAIMAVCVMVKFATDITVEERKREHMPGGAVGGGGGVYHYTKSMGVITLNDNSSLPIAERFPYVAAITRNSSALWSFACFASVVLIKWVITSAHCRRPGATHRILLFHDFARNYTHTYPILFWRLHEKFNMTNPTPRHDIAVAKLNVDFYPLTMKASVFDEKKVTAVEASIWKTVSTMDKKLYLTNDFDKYEVKIINSVRCFESYGVELDESMMCIDMSDYEDCFVHEFGPIYNGDKVVGILAAKPRDCDMKLAIFTNISYYTNWILRSTHTTYYG
ncbi:kallikrein-11-like [Trichoplusia ni]|uniref:Kallikrein-11-like n=1 Tax=Trichoplusia ni TaxID=7111 RepID=A0A7E5W7C5_TRINI|nr:kallikrein-11-like [Trichoplusia ni]